MLREVRRSGQRTNKMAQVAPGLDIDPTVLSHLPEGATVIGFQNLHLSDWCDTNRYDVELPDGRIERFFEKVRFSGLVLLLL